MTSASLLLLAFLAICGSTLSTPVREIDLPASSEVDMPSDSTGLLADLKPMDVTEDDDMKANGSEADVVVKEQEEDSSSEEVGQGHGDQDAGTPPDEDLYMRANQLSNQEEERNMSDS